MATIEANQARMQAETTSIKSSASASLPSSAWIRDNAENILFLEHLRRQAAEDDLYGWRGQISSEEYQARLDQMLTMNTECGSSSCASSECSSSSSCGSACATSACSEDYSMLFDRISVLENRCGESSSSCGGGEFSSCGGNCEMYGQKMLMLQSELRKQRLMIQRLYQQVTIMSQTSGGCDGNCLFF